MLGLELIESRNQNAGKSDGVFFLLPSTFVKLCFTGRNPQRDPQRYPECSTFERNKDQVFSWLLL